MYCRDGCYNGYCESDIDCDVDILNYKYHLGIEKKDFETISGFISYKHGRIAKRGDSFVYKDYKYTILDSDLKKIYRIEIIKN